VIQSTFPIVDVLEFFKEVFTENNIDCSAYTTSDFGCVSCWFNDVGYQLVLIVLVFGHQYKTLEFWTISAILYSNLLAQYSKLINCQLV
jgi:hypothetical protein